MDERRSGRREWQNIFVKLFSTRNAFGELIHLCTSMVACRCKHNTKTLAWTCNVEWMDVCACFGVSALVCVCVRASVHVYKCSSETHCACLKRGKWTNVRSLHTICTHLDDYKIIKGNEAIECTQASLQPFKLQSSGELSFSRFIFHIIPPTTINSGKIFL